MFDGQNVDLGDADIVKRCQISFGFLLVPNEIRTAQII